MGRFDENWKKAYEKLAEDYFELQEEIRNLDVTYEKLSNTYQELLHNTDQHFKNSTIKGCCGQAAYVVDPSGEVTVVGDYKVTVTKI